MKDFDFDELDRAVNSALSGTSSANSPVSSSDNDKSELTNETVVNLDGVATKNALVEPIKPAAEGTSISTPAPAQSTAPTAPLAARRSTGRFMDMVHSSSDMRSAARPIQSPLVKPQSSTPETAAAPVEDKKEEPEASAVQSTPLESPFLPDAKVEKRPLGGPVLLDEPNEPRLEAPDGPRIEALADLPDPIDFHTAQQEVANEDATEKVEEPVSEKTDEAAPEESKVPETSEVPEVPELNTDTTPETAMGDVAAQKIDAELIDIDATVEPETYGPTSITQQYKEQPSSTAESGAIFDTESYHQPLSPVAKKKSGVWVIVLIILLIVLGAGLGAAFYLYVLPML